MRIFPLPLVFLFNFHSKNNVVYVLLIFFILSISFFGVRGYKTYSDKWLCMWVIIHFISVRYQQKILFSFDFKIRKCSQIKHTPSARFWIRSRIRSPFLRSAGRHVRCWYYKHIIKTKKKTTSVRCVPIWPIWFEVKNRLHHSLWIAL